MSAIQEHERSGKGRFVNYSQLPDIMWEQILPKEFGVPVDANGIAHMQKVSGVYSKGRGYKANKEWTEDSTKKLSTAPQSVLQAAELVMRPVFGQMESLSTSSQA